MQRYVLITNRPASPPVRDGPELQPLVPELYSDFENRCKQQKKNSLHLAPNHDHPRVLAGVSSGLKSNTRLPTHEVRVRDTVSSYEQKQNADRVSVFGLGILCCNTATIDHNNLTYPSSYYHRRSQGAIGWRLSALLVTDIHD